MFHFSTKANTLRQLENKLLVAKVLPQFVISQKVWQDNKEKVLKVFANSCSWANSKLIVRSSALVEDSIDNSYAGAFDSILNVAPEALENAIDQVFASYGEFVEGNQVLIQPMLEKVDISGVAFSIDPNNLSDYIVINFDDHSGTTDSITGGYASSKTYYHAKSEPIDLVPLHLKSVVNLVQELEKITNIPNIDVEFAICGQECYLLQVRPLVIKGTYKSENLDLHSIYEIVDSKMQPQPFLLGNRGIFGVMPDWNPAEIIGLRPKPLSLSMYREIVTDAIWAYQRHNYGYRDLRSCPLMLSFGGIPYIDVRVSFNSFIPKDLDDKIAEKLVNYYLDRLRKNPALHDKIEFEIIFSCYTFDLDERIKVLENYGFSSYEIEAIKSSLLNLTNNIIDPESPLIANDLHKIDTLIKRRELILKETNSVSKLYWLVEDTKRYGTLPFAGLARAGFIAVQLLNSLVSSRLFSVEDKEEFMRSINSVSSQMSSDLVSLPKEKFLEKYGHLRPGTYDIMSARYDESPDLYFDWNNIKKAEDQDNDKRFNISIDKLKLLDNLLKKHNMKCTVLSFFDFISKAIEAREYSKFIFSKNISDFFVIFEKFAAKFNISREDCSFISLKSVLDLYHSCDDPEYILKRAVEKGKKQYAKALKINLPPLITNSEQVYSFEISSLQPNFITQKKCVGEVQFSENVTNLKDSIVLIPSADPGFDWIFTKGISGFITKYGGINSHMAIRAGELSIPAVIGVGEVLYDKFQNAKILEIDACNKKVEILCAR